jgi:hypothetical protein
MRQKGILLVWCSTSLCLYDGLKQIYCPTTSIDLVNNCSWKRERTRPLFWIPGIWVYIYVFVLVSRFISSSGFVSKNLLFHLVGALVWEIHPKLLMTFQDTAAPLLFDEAIRTNSVKGTLELSCWKKNQLKGWSSIPFLQSDYIFFYRAHNFSLPFSFDDLDWSPALMIGDHHTWFTLIALAHDLVLSVTGWRIHCLGKMRPYFDPEYENFNQRINPPRCVSNFYHSN